ncbi:12596_t:CDS:2 [Cetraspora pellucida]|uniref:12596_t:CDS:1 n=1 Tax=Cetraspora pellucida TaxID=1433469 RepID=A0ACA9PFV0_9GLOM|nr:12596_t:CDS:2 [Cetraspora pellucida]
MMDKEIFMYKTFKVNFIKKFEQEFNIKLFSEDIRENNIFECVGTYSSKNFLIYFIYETLYVKVPQYLFSQVIKNIPKNFDRSKVIITSNQNLDEYKMLPSDITICDHKNLYITFKQVIGWKSNRRNAQQPSPVSPPLINKEIQLQRTLDDYEKQVDNIVADNLNNFNDKGFNFREKDSTITCEESGETICKESDEIMYEESDETILKEIVDLFDNQKDFRNWSSDIKRSTTRRKNQDDFDLQEKMRKIQNTIDTLEKDENNDICDYDDNDSINENFKDILESEKIQDSINDSVENDIMKIQIENIDNEDKKNNNNENISKRVVITNPGEFTYGGISFKNCDKVEIIEY